MDEVKRKRPKQLRSSDLCEIEWTYATPEEEEQHRRITQEIIDLSKKLEPYEAEMRILYKARTNLYERWKGRYKYGKRK